MRILLIIATLATCLIASQSFGAQPRRPAVYVPISVASGGGEFRRVLRRQFPGTTFSVKFVGFDPHPSGRAGYYTAQPIRNPPRGIPLTSRINTTVDLGNAPNSPQGRARVGSLDLVLPSEQRATIRKRK
jgi:hypothetical protein